ncbi:hypothetical protein CK203_034709 [Vitis vinifera]|uniref:Uncharacterized protein n=1 Tax=Vitis vinifera TaxID=29760 RepID=A0A438HWD4_VITVI|nr:hypothetical protein CK203_034709 [Vitis vinifera]
MNPLLAHSTHVGPPSGDGIHHIDFVEDDSIHMLSWDDGFPEPIVLDDGYEVDTMGSQTSTPFSLILDWVPFELTPTASLATPSQGLFVPFILRLDDDDLERRDVQIVTRSGRVAQPLPLVAKPFDGAVSHGEVRIEDDEILRQLQIGCLGHRVPSVLLDNGSTLNVCLLATTIALGYASSNFGPSTQKVLRIPTFFNLLLGRPWIHKAGAIPYSLHQKVQTLKVGDFCRDLVAMSFDQHSSTVVLNMMREADYRHMTRLHRERVRTRLICTPFDYPIRPYRMSLADYFIRGSEIVEMVQPESASPFDVFGVSAIEVVEEIQTVLAPELMKDVTIDYEITQPDSDRDSSDHDSDPIDERISPTIGDLETIDFGTEDQPRELKIGSPLSTDENDRLIHLLRSYLDVFTWYYKDMPGLDPSIVQHHLPILPHVRPVK